MTAKQPDLTKITTKFGQLYDRASKANEIKQKAQESFFNALTQILETKVLKQQIVDKKYDDLTAQEFIDRYYPGWRILHTQDNLLTIEEDPKYLKNIFVNKEDGRVYGRTVAQSSQQLDNERLIVENPDLWNQITEWPEPWYSLIYNFTFSLFCHVDYYTNADADKYKPDYPSQEERFKQELDEYLSNNGLQKTIKNPEKWTDEQLSLVSEYMVPGKISIRLVAPRAATEEELQ